MRVRFNVWPVVLLAALLAALPAEAYVGPGAGFAFLSSFLTLLVVFFSALFSLISWPFRQLVRLLRRRKVYTRAKVKRVVILGLDGLDPELATRYMAEGKLPNFARLREQGTFAPLATTVPPISPVAWSSFQTGVNPGRHNIYDFLARYPDRYLPYLSSVEIRPPRRSLRLGSYMLPLGRPRLRLLRKSQPFWNYLAEAGIFCSVLRVPITFPPEKFSGVLLSGMCVPDLRGSQGTFSYYSTRAAGGGADDRERVLPLVRQGEPYTAELIGPDNHLRRNGGEALRLSFTLRVEPAHAVAELEVSGRRVRLKQGEYSDWVPLAFKAGLGVRVHGVCRFYLKQVSPEVELYVTPINIDPLKPALPVSHPLAYSMYLAKLFGPYATLGLAEDTVALNEGLLDDDAFLRQCYLIHEERERMFFDALEKTPRGLCACVFDTPDRIQHMFWRYLERGHPANPGGAQADQYARVIEKMYERMDALVGDTLARLGSDAVLVVLSDHGFKSFRRGVNLNSWLHQNGYLALQEGTQESGEWFKEVDWTGTRAYALGLNGLYLNISGRERSGTVNPGAAAEALKRELLEKLSGLKDPDTGQVAIRELFDRRAVFNGPYVENAPDLIVGYNIGYRAAWESVTGKVTRSVFEDNRKAWSGDHCIDPRLVPGVLFSNRKIARTELAMVDIAPTVLDLFGVKIPPHLEGRAWFQAGLDG